LKPLERGQRGFDQLQITVLEFDCPDQIAGVANLPTQRIMQRDGVLQRRRAIWASRLASSGLVDLRDRAILGASGVLTNRCGRIATASQSSAKLFTLPARRAMMPEVCSRHPSRGH
jgi:hypothetical protein